MRGDTATAARLTALADRTRESFRARFRRPDLDYLADVVDGPDGDDWSLRPNQIFALSLPFPLLEGDEARAVLDAVGRSLLTSYGLRSLTPQDPAYRGTYGGDQVHRDGSYHQGPVWSWLLGPYAEASPRLTGDRDAALSVLRPLGDHLRDAGLRLRLGDLRGRPATPAEGMRRPGVGRRRDAESLAIARPFVLSTRVTTRALQKTAAIRLECV